jgi:hypothetical protein
MPMVVLPVLLGVDGLLKVIVELASRHCYVSRVRSDGGGHRVGVGAFVDVVLDRS